MDRILRFNMNKVFSLLIAVFSTLSAPFALADNSTAKENFSYSFQPLSWYSLEELTEAEKSRLPEFCSGKYRPVAISPRTEKSILVEADESTASKTGDALFSGNVEFSQLDRSKVFTTYSVMSF